MIQAKKKKKFKCWQKSANKPENKGWLAIEQVSGKKGVKKMAIIYHKGNPIHIQTQLIPINSGNG